MKAEILHLVERSTHGSCKLESSKIFNLPPASAAPVPLWSGVVDSVTRLGDELELSLSAELPALRWRVADDPFVNDARDLGLRLPVVLGRAERVAAINWRVGAVTQLAADAAIGATSLELTDASGFPGSGTVSLGGGEIATYTGTTGSTLTGVAGIAKAHGAGDTVVEQLVGVAVYVLSAEPASAVSALYVLAPWFQQLVRVTTAWTLTLADLNAVPGQAATTARFTAAQLRSLIDAVNLAAVSQQPRRSTDAEAPPSLMPTIAGPDTATVSAVSSPMRAGSVAADTAYPINSSGTAAGNWPPEVLDGGRIRYIFSDYSVRRALARLTVLRPVRYDSASSTVGL